MKKIITYELSWLGVLFFLFLGHNVVSLPEWYLNKLLFVKCAFVGGIGGALYCLRAVYLNRCVLKQWDDNWAVWYYLRPIVSLVTGLISCVFLRAGLLVLDASPGADSADYGYIALAFIAGYNVDNLLKRLESIAQSAWGVTPSRASSGTDGINQKESQNG